MEATWFSKVLYMLDAIPQHHPNNKDLTMDVSEVLVLKGLPFLQLTLSLLRDVLHRHGFSSLVCKAMAGAT